MNTFRGIKSRQRCEGRVLRFSSTLHALCERVNRQRTRSQLYASGSSRGARNGCFDILAMELMLLCISGQINSSILFCFFSPHFQWKQIKSRVQKQTRSSDVNNNIDYEIHNKSHIIYCICYVSAFART